MSSGKCLEIKKKGVEITGIKPIFSFDAKYVVCGHGGGVRVYSTVTSLCIHTLPTSQSKPVVAYVFNPINQAQLLTFDENGGVSSWDYLDGTAIKRIDLEFPGPLSNVYAVGKRMYACVKNSNPDTSGSADVSGIIMQIHIDYKLSTNKCRYKKMLYDVKLEPHMTAFDTKGRYIANVGGEILRAYLIDAGKVKRHFISDRYFTCVACHPTEICVATGDNTGRILLWYNFMTSNNPAKNRLHWHTNPVMDLDFTSEGSYLYSVGSECVLLKWLCKSGSRDFLPRLGAPIKFVSVDRSSNALVATSHVDNGIQLIDTLTMKVKHIIQGLTRNPQLEASSTGLLYDPRSKCLVLNGRIGHLQFYDWKTDQQLYNLDIVGHNVMTSERHSKVFNTDVTVAAFSDCGSWLITCDTRDDQCTQAEVSLKFWVYKYDQHTYELNTCVEHPHDALVTCVAYRHQQIRSSGHTEQREHTFVTCSLDGRIKLWTLTDDTDIYKSNECWSCSSVTSYKCNTSGTAMTVCSKCAYSCDGSVLALVYKPYTITLWTVHSGTLQLQLVDKLTPPIHQSQAISDICFGYGGDLCNSMLVSASGSASGDVPVPAVIHVWNVITGQLMHTINQCSDVSSIHCLISDINSQYLAAFTSNKHVFIFTPDDPKPAYVHDISVITNNNSDITSAVFIPTLDNNITIGCVNTNQEVYMLSSRVDASTDTADVKTDIMPADHSLHHTTFSGLVSAASHCKHTADTPQHHTISPPQHHTHVNKGTNVLHDLLMTPVHLLPPTSLLCSRFISSLSKKTRLQDHSSVIKTVNDAADDAVMSSGDSDDDNDDAPYQQAKEQQQPHRSKHRDGQENMYKHLSSIKIPTDIDYSWITPQVFRHKASGKS